MDIGKTIGDQINRLSTGITEVVKDYRSGTPELKNAAIVRITGAALFVLGLYITAPAVFAFLTGQPGIFSSLLFGVTAIILGHDFEVVGDNWSTMHGGKIIHSNGIADAAKGILKTVKKAISAEKEALSTSEQTSPLLNGTWLLKHIYAALPSTPAEQR